MSTRHSRRTGFPKSVGNQTSRGIALILIDARSKTNMSPKQGLFLLKYIFQPLIFREMLVYHSVSEVNQHIDFQKGR